MIDKVGELCTGCGACEAICPFNAIDFKRKDTLFTYPHIDPIKCTQCNLCERACPVLNTQPIAAINQQSYAAMNHEKPATSSSGGIFYALAKAIIEQGGKVYGATMDEQATVHHISVQSLDKLGSLCGSKYVQSNISKEIYYDIKRNLINGEEVLFAGTPCQVWGLRLFLRKDYSNLHLIDLICHGVPSPKVFNDYIGYIEKLRFKRVKNFQCRDNRAGWNKIFKSTIEYANGSREHNTGLANLWNRIFFSELISRPACSQCKFSNFNRVGDITLGDFWGKDNAKSVEHHEGVSLCICNTPKGKQMLADAKISLNEAETTEKEHPNLYHPTCQNPKSEEFTEYYQEHGFSDAISKYFGFSRWLDFKLQIHKLLTTRIWKR